MMIAPIRTMPERFLNVDDKERGGRRGHEIPLGGRGTISRARTAGKARRGPKADKKRHAKRSRSRSHGGSSRIGKLCPLLSDKRPQGAFYSSLAALTIPAVLKNRSLPRNRSRALYG